MLEILERIVEGKGEPDDIERLEQLADMISNTALCGLGKSAPLPVISTIKAFRKEYLEHINEKVEEFKKADGNLYAIYATPAENLCGLQVKQFRKKYGIIENVSDREYVSNGFHCHVTEDISPIQKQNLEYRFWELSNLSLIHI